MTEISTLKCKIFADGADLSAITRLAADPLIKGFTTNPTLMKAAGVQDYLSFSKSVIEIVGERPLSLEVFSDEFDEMYRQAHLLSELGTSVFVKIPITNTKKESSIPLIQTLCKEGIQLNVTAVFTKDQIDKTVAVLATGPKSFLSVFAGRIADAGIDPVPIMRHALSTLNTSANVEVIWASPREIFNVVQASDIGCHVITVTPDLLKKMSSLGKDLEEFSLETVRMFASDAAAAGYEL